MKDRLSNVQLEINNVSYSYNEQAVIKNLDVNIQKGEFLVVVGPSGCGKTTFLNLLSGHLIPKEGTIKTRGLIRTVYQNTGLFPWYTVSENIRMGFSNTDLSSQNQELQELIELIHLQGFEDHYPHQLSGGMKQRVEIARVLAGDSDILLMDEPFSALDYLSRIRMRRELLRLLVKRPRTVVFVTHDIEEAAILADRVLVLSKRPTSICREIILESGHPRDLTSDNVTSWKKIILHELGLEAFGEANNESLAKIDLLS